ncbi:MAG: phosphodiester glycosidase family protein [Chitinophagaceae bacterium]
MAHNIASVKVKDSLYYYPMRGALGLNRRRKADIAWVFSDTANRNPMAIQTHPVLFSGTDPDPDIAAMRKVTAKEHVKLKRWKNIITAIAGGPVLVQRGSIAITNEQEMIFTGKAVNDKHPRTAMGYTRDGRLIILVVQGRAAGTAEGATLGQEARMLADIGCYEAVNLDGGGSSCMLVNGKETIRPSDKEGQRPIPAVFMIKRVK